MKKSTLLFLSLCLSIILSAQSSTSNINRTLAKEAALENAHSFVNLIPQGQEKDYGFDSRADFDKIKIGEPYQTYFMVKQANEIVFTDVNEWRVPLLVDGKFVALVSVHIKEGKGEVVDFGASGLASFLQKFEAQFKGENEHVLIRNTALAKDFIAPNFSALCSQIKSAGFTTINSNASELLYPIGNTNNEPLKIKAIQSLTLAAPSK